MPEPRFTISGAYTGRVHAVDVPASEVRSWFARYHVPCPVLAQLAIGDRVGTDPAMAVGIVAVRIS
jgi:hypothetical protein